MEHKSYIFWGHFNAENETTLLGDLLWHSIIRVTRAVTFTLPTEQSRKAVRGVMGSCSQELPVTTMRVVLGAQRPMAGRKNLLN
jgi:hypothetical protein